VALGITSGGGCKGGGRERYSVKDGERRQFAGWVGRVSAGDWHEYVAEAPGDHVQVFWDGQQVLDHHVSTSLDAAFDDLEARAD
jgi:hypothetical protein